MATIEKYETTAGATRYRVRYRTPDRRQTTKRGFPTKRDAQAWANQLEVDKRKGAYVAPAAGRVKLGDYAREWLDSKHKLKPSTRARYRVVLDTFIGNRAEVALGDISRQLVREWVADLSVDLAPASVHKTIGVLRQVLGMAVRENRLVMNPVDGVELPAVGSVEQRFLTLEQLHLLADAAGEQTTVYDFKLHELRHTAASLAIQAGANIKALQNMLGHESAGLTLDRYGHLYGSDVEAVGVAINELLTRKCGQSVVTDSTTTVVDLYLNTA